MIYNKKSLERYIVILFICSVILGSFLTFILNTSVLKVDDPRCNDIDYEITKSCLNNGRIQISINNKGIAGFYISNSVKDVFIEPGKTLDVNIYEEGNTYEIIPYLIFVKDKIVCNGKKTKVEAYSKC